MQGFESGRAIRAHSIELCQHRRYRKKGVLVQRLRHCFEVTCTCTCHAFSFPGLRREVTLTGRAPFGEAAHSFFSPRLVETPTDGFPGERAPRIATK